MNRKKVKEEYNTLAVLNKLTNLMIDEQIVNKQKAFLYLKCKKYHDLFLKEKEKSKRLENCLEKEMHKKADEKTNEKTYSDSEKENINNLNVDLNQLEFNYEEKNIQVDDKIKDLYEIIEDKDKKIIELENKVIKMQIIKRYENNGNNFNINNKNNGENEDLIIDLKSKLEYSRVEGDRDRRNLNSKLKEFMIKYEETKTKYDQCYSQLGHSLTNLEDIRKFHMSRDISKIKKITQITSQIKTFEFMIKDIEKQICGIEKMYYDLCDYFTLLEDTNKRLNERINKYKMVSNKVGYSNRGGECINVEGKCSRKIEFNGGVGDKTSIKGDTHIPTLTNQSTLKSSHQNFQLDDSSFYEQEINNLLVLCDSLTEENKVLEEERDLLQSQIDFFKRRNLSLEKDCELIRLKESSFFDHIKTYLLKINELNEIIQKNCKKLEISNQERNKLTKLNVERISCIEKYKEDLRNKDLEINIQKKKYNDFVLLLEDYNRRFEDRLRSGRSSSSDLFIPCNLCDTNSKNVALITCMHTFCDECIESRIKFRNRRCPTCGIPFGGADVKKIYL